jgi:hypothetical protein
MDVPEHLWRHPAAAAIDSLAGRFGWAVSPSIQDPEAEWADPSRIDEFMAAYEADGLSEDERFLLMAILLNSFEFADRPLADWPQWARTLQLLDRDIALHVHSVLYFAGPGGSADEGWRIGRDLWRIAERYANRFGYTLPPA